MKALLFLLLCAQRENSECLKAVEIEDIWK